ncbi:hypothetical protein FACS1894182_12240 [Bacteroidia bacterium]|nr:hypothetical protein FACS1894182_12240 [Bacteroidia bacterium]
MCPKLVTESVCKLIKDNELGGLKFEAIILCSDNPKETLPSNADHGTLMDRK